MSEDMPPRPPNKAWVREAAGDRILLTWPDDEFVVSVERAGGDADE